MNNAIDFSVLDALTNNQPATSPQDALKDTGEYKHIAGNQDAPQTAPEPPPAVYSKLVAQERNKAAQIEAAARQMEVYRTHQEAIRRSGQLMTSITKGIQAGESPIVLLLKALECVSCATGESAVFYEQNRQNLIAVYGAGLLDAVPLDMELAEVRRRLAMLTRPELDAEPEDSKRRIAAAVKAHEARAATLEIMINERRANAEKSDISDTLKSG